MHINPRLTAFFISGDLMKISEKIAKAVRIVTAPPAFIGLLLVGCIAREGGAFAPPGLFVSVFFLQVLTPALAYPAQKILPRFRDQGRDGQRRLAFIFTAAGYTLALACALIFRAGSGLLFITVTYFIAALLLAVINKFSRVHASGHACSSIGTMACMIKFFGNALIAPCAVVAAVTMWASLKLGRHTASEFIMGAATGIAAFCISLIII